MLFSPIKSGLCKSALDFSFVHIRAARFCVVLISDVRIVMCCAVLKNPCCARSVLCKLDLYKPHLSSGS
jgi:hypothetical protein